MSEDKLTPDEIALMEQWLDEQDLAPEPVELTQAELLADSYLKEFPLVSAKFASHDVALRVVAKQMQRSLDVKSKKP